MDITFLGAAGTVTGSRHLITTGDTTLLVDCGLFQGFKNLRQQNWRRFPVDPASIDAVLLTHAHIDHSGYLPVLIDQGFRGRIYATPPTRALCEILLRDSAHLAEEDAAYLNRKGLSKHHPAQPLTTAASAARTMSHFEDVETGDEIEIMDVTISAQESGHILGAVGWLIDDGARRVYCSGDIGRGSDPLMRSPRPPPAADALLMESTYGGRFHPDIEPVEELTTAIAPTLAAGGVVLIPAFAVGRAQNLLYCLHQGMRAGHLPEVPVHLDSPMATDVTEVYQRFSDYHRLNARQCEGICRDVDFVASSTESKALTGREGPRVIIAGSGMLTGGRVLHHLHALAGDPANLILMPGYQAPGTRGGDLIDGRRQIKLHGAWVDVHMQVSVLSSMSGHADHNELMAWFASATSPPPHCFLVHGSEDCAEQLRRDLQERHATEFIVPLQHDRVTV